MRANSINIRSICYFGLLSGSVLSAQTVAFTPKTVPFPNQGINTSSTPYNITLTNNQTTAVSISSIQASAPYSQVNNCGTSLAPAKACTISVTFHPTAVAYYSSTLTIRDSATNSPQTIALTGNGVVPITYSPKQIPFPNQGINSTSSPLNLTVTNNQTTAISVASIQTAAPFAQTNNCGTSIQGGHSCTISVTFSPTAVKFYSSTLTLHDSSSNSPQVVSLSGNGIMPVKFTPVMGGLYFTRQIANTPSTPQLITITNEQTTPLTFTSMSGTAQFPFTSNCGNGVGGGQLAAGASCTIQVSFKPSAATSYSANLTIAENAYGSPIVIPLGGVGFSGTPPPAIVVTPPTPCLLPTQNQQFSLQFQGTGSQAVFWYVDGIKNGNASTGMISNTGLYTAPSVSAVHHVRAVSQAISTLGGSATASVTTTPGFVIYPYVASIPLGGQQTFQAQTCSTPDPNSLSYTVDGIAGGNGTVGTVSNTGLYTAPRVAGKHTVKVTDNTLNKSTAGVVTVFSSIAADFGSRANNTAVVPAGMFGYGRAESLQKNSDRSLLTTAGVTEARLAAQIPNVFATSTPNWTKIDPLIASIQTTGQHALLQLNQSPAWLQPTSGKCAGTSFAAPVNIAQWTDIARQYVAHMDATFPGVVLDYEIWNEPNSTGMCSNDNLTTYMSLYASAAPAMKAQAAQDGRSIRVGGPVLSGYTSAWITPFLSDARTAPYVDFVSYHQYFEGTTGLGATWNTYTGFPSLYNSTQDPSNGALAEYKRFQALVAAGKQPGGPRTPMYVTEYNTDWAFYQDCCRNNPTYAPVFNALYLTDMLDSVYNGLAQPPAKVYYFAGSAYPYFCMIGVKDSNNDCLYSTGATPVPYPQYYAFDLLASPNYLGLAGGGHMAASISTPTGGGGIATTAFYTPTQDAIVIINPTSTAYSQIPVTFTNPGFSTTQGTLYNIVNGVQINAATISFAVQGTSLTAPVDVPAYSVQAVSIK